MKIKILISFLIILFTGVGVAISFLLNSEINIIYSGTATVIERRSASEVIVRLNEEPEVKIQNELIVYSNIFAIKDQVEIEYSKKGQNYIITKVSAQAELDSKKTYIASKISADPTVIKYLSLISGKSSAEKVFSEIIAMPSELSGQKFNLINETEFYNIRFYKTDTDFIHILKDEKVIISLLEDFKVVSIENITNEKRINLPYTFTNRTVTFIGLGEGMYSLKLSFKNENIINYIFI